MANSSKTAFDLEAGRVYLQQLESLLSTLNELWPTVNSQWANLDSCWKDQQADNFRELFSRIDATYGTCEQACASHIATLREQIRIAEAAQEKLNLLGD